MLSKEEKDCSLFGMAVDRKLIGMWAGVAFFLLTMLVDSPFHDLSEVGWRAMGLGCAMAIWWTTECIPLAATAFLPLVVAPVVGIASMKTIAASYSHPLIFLFLGGFILSIAMERTGLHLRIARSVVAAIGSNPKRQVGGMMLVTAFLSMWMSNTATAIMMLPVAVSTAKLVEDDSVDRSSEFGAILLLGIAYSASIGGMATLIGTPPNALLAAYLESAYGLQIGFGEWMKIGLPFSCVLLLLAWLWLTRKGLARSGSEASTRRIAKELREMGAMSRAEKTVLVVFSLAAASWMSRVYLARITGLEITDTGIAMSAALALFLLPFGGGSGERLIDWSHAQKLPWGVLMLFGGGLALATMIKDSGLADFIGGRFGELGGGSVILVLAVVVTTIVFLTEVTSNTATTAALLPLMGPVALSMGVSPIVLAIPVALAVSCAFMLPVATPPNAIVFGSGILKIEQMARMGFALNIMAICVLVAFAKWVLPLVF
ncbi:transporter, DASS family [Verrucomicrobiia bacterium DG1235]|nr:transporter, DASS family [Verrucomicrobiae bacterium DG1235]